MAFWDDLGEKVEEGVGGYTDPWGIRDKGVDWYKKQGGPYPGLGRDDIAKHFANPNTWWEAGKDPGSVPDYLKEWWKNLSERGEDPGVPKYEGGPGVGGELEDLSGKRKELLKNLKMTEGQAMGRLTEQTLQTQGAVDRQLNSLLKDSGVSFGQAKRLAGAQQAQAGLLRSGFTQSRMEGLSSNQLQAEGALTSQADQLKRQADLTRLQAGEQVTNRRKEIQNRLLDLEIAGLSSARFNEEIQTIRLDFDKFVNDLSISSQAKQDLAGALGGLGQLGGYAASS